MNQFCAGFLAREITIDENQDTHKMPPIGPARKSACCSDKAWGLTRVSVFWDRGIITEDDSRDGIRYIRHQILSRRLPASSLLGDDIHCPDDSLGFKACKHIRTALDSFRSFRNIADCYVGNTQDTRFLLHRAAIGNHAKGVLLKPNKVDEAKRFEEAEARANQVYPEFLRFRTSSWMQRTEDG